MKLIFILSAIGLLITLMVVLADRLLHRDLDGESRQGRLTTFLVKRLGGEPILWLCMVVIAFLTVREIFS